MVCVFFCWLLRPLCLPSNNLYGPLANKELFINGLSFFLGPLTNNNLTINGLFNFYGPLTNKQLSIDGPLTNKELNIDGPLTNNILNIDGPLTNKPYHLLKNKPSPLILVTPPLFSIS